MLQEHDARLSLGPAGATTSNLVIAHPEIGKVGCQDETGVDRSSESGYVKVDPFKRTSVQRSFSDSCMKLDDFGGVISGSTGLMQQNCRSEVNIGCRDGDRPALSSAYDSFELCVHDSFRQGSLPLVMLSQALAS